tara:strand:- start:359 stop:565 length:207 start_codon:yes stop_codon:yes gene_type:complete
MTATKKKIDQHVTRASSQLGISKRVFIDRAIRFYLDKITPSINFQGEIMTWQSASESDIVAFNKKNNL